MRKQQVPFCVEEINVSVQEELNPTTMMERLVDV